MSVGGMLEVVIGLSFVFFLASIVCSAAAELLAAGGNRRGRNLERAIEELLGKSWYDRFVEEPMIRALGKTRKRLGFRFPSYLDASDFVTASRNSAGRARQEIAPGPDTPALADVVARAGRDDESKDAAAEHLYDTAMDRASGAFTRQTRWLLLALGFVLAIGLNVDTVAMARRLWRDPTVREVIVEQAKNETADGDDASKKLRNLELPIGWQREGAGPNSPRRWPGTDVERWVAKLPGWTVTAVAVTFGAPFWFDLLGQFVRLRTSVKPGESDADKKKKRDEKRRRRRGRRLRPAT